MGGTALCPGAALAQQAAAESEAGNQGSESSVSTVIDGIVMARQAQGFVDLADLERVEALRGPRMSAMRVNRRDRTVRRREPELLF
ncbi:hypothetical protein V474_23185 [Novosphingobium barchaimii LL02]|uniref:TonB-dependent receptor plug domain-containing protein n=1 Tax=Novosphingobium barchaimii LL02 TaxID=1114963 RepID=A0A0J7XRG1_9SPHN|nr:hypothetical protein V474_23185 [Novosphingobium barchaimii LL02]